ncbi:uncharacterized protein LOC128178444 isoform X2 [Crassostrea angulata]|uniref:uncharacterized protein LOC128178444 isoform X2 n=1 Tax=Magallana angulata TaxID=2784310 RepID=UPI0022B16CAE|nr:uncharacterized protein LOC128178444 isoform X2 [Crassostrea angulata]
MAGQYLDISDEVLQMHNEIRENGKYNYMICKINRERLVIEHIEQLDDLGNQPYQAFLRTLSAKQEFRYGFVVYNLNKDNNLLRKTVGVMWLPTFQMKKKFKQTASTLKDVLSADLFLEAITELSLSSICIESGFRKFGE